MKKSIAVICFLSLLFLSACKGSEKGEITVADAGYTCEALVDYGENFSSKIVVHAMGGGVFSLTVKEPQNISGLTFSFNKDEMSLSHNSISGRKNFPSGYGGFAEILNKIFLKITTSNLVIHKENGEYSYEGKTSYYPFRVVFNDEGFPLSITVKSENLKATFSNWEY